MHVVLFPTVALKHEQDTKAHGLTMQLSATCNPDQPEGSSYAEGSYSGSNLRGDSNQPYPTEMVSYGVGAGSGGRSYGGTSQMPPTADPMQHAWIERSNTMSGHALDHLVVEISRDGVTTYFCGWEGCRYPVGFAKRTQLITHIRSVHLQEKPFLCTTCNAVFERKQDAVRHVASMNSRQYRCSNCDRVFTRKQYRDTHEDTCLPRES
ncbi:hypothetical protein JB92DRAFT_2945332 [Gautieria morchelliformis]|nr:hypothetical protein JB92DRAFT_2945332 [Gautieria morchelliformis]